MVRYIWKCVECGDIGTFDTPEEFFKVIYCGLCAGDTGKDVLIHKRIEEINENKG